MKYSQLGIWNIQSGILYPIGYFLLIVLYYAWTSGGYPLIIEMFFKSITDTFSNKRTAILVWWSAPSQHSVIIFPVELDFRDYFMVETQPDRTLKWKKCQEDTGLCFWKRVWCLTVSCIHSVTKIYFQIIKIVIRKLVNSSSIAIPTRCIS